MIRRVFLAVVLLVVGLIGYAVFKENVWYNGDVTKAFSAAPTSRPAADVDLDTAIRLVVPDGTPRADAEALFASNGFQCGDHGSELGWLCMRTPGLQIACAETWAVSYVVAPDDSVMVKGASKSTSCL